MIIVECQQGTPEWLQARAGKVTASRISDILAKGKGTAEAATRLDYKYQLVTEILTGRPAEDGFTNAAMQWGTEQEPFARAAYEMFTDCIVDQVGMVIHPRIERGAASPDGLVNSHGLVEIKCPKTQTHINYLTAGIVPSKYEPQMSWQLACTERLHCDFASFDPRLPEDLQLFVVPFKRNDDRIAEIEAEVEKFLSEVDAIVAKLRGRRVAA